MLDEGPQSEGTQVADLMDYMDSSDMGDSETSNEGSIAPDEGATDEVATPQESDESDGHPREDEAAEGEVESDDETASATPQAEGATPEAPSWEPTTPFTYTVGQQSHALGGAVVGADGVVYIPPENREEVERLVSRGRYHEEVYPRERQQWQRQLQAAQNQFNADAVKAQASAKFFDDLANQPDEKILEFIANWRINRPQLVAQQERAVAQELYRRAQEAQAGDPVEREYRQQEQKGQTITQLVNNYASQPQYSFLSQDDWTKFYNRLNRNQAQLFTTADRDYGPHETSNGIPVQKGQIALNTAWLNEELTEFATMVQASQNQRAQVSKAQEFNRQQKAAGGKRVPPQTGARTSTSAPRDPNTGQFKSGKQWRERMFDLMGMVDATPE